MMGRPSSGLHGAPFSPLDDGEAVERAERRAVRLIALSFIGLGLYVVVNSVRELLQLGDAPERSAAGIVVVAASLVVMPGLFWAKRRVAARLGSVALVADAGQTR